MIMLVAAHKAIVVMIEKSNCCYNAENWPNTPFNFTKGGTVTLCSSYCENRCYFIFNVNTYSLK